MLESGTWSRQPRQRRQRLNKTCGLPQGQSEQVLGGQAKLDGGIGEMRAAPAFATGSGKPGHVLIQPDGQRASRFERCVVLLLVGGAVAGLGLQGLTHCPRLPEADR